MGSVMESAIESFIACENCEQLHQRLALDRGEKAICQRCGDRLYGSEIGSLERTLALNIASLALFGIANLMLFLQVSMEGRAQTNRIVSGVTDLVGFDFMPLAALIFFTTHVGRTP